MKPGSAALANAASRQPMLAEWATRLHAQVGRAILLPRARRALPLALREFDAGAKALLAAAPSPEIRENYRLLDLLWADYRPHVARAPATEAMEKLLERHEEVVWIAAKGARLLHDADTRFARLRLAGEARLQSQRIARAHLFTQASGRSPQREAELRSANADYRRAMDALLAAPDISAEIATELQLAEDQYSFLRQAAQGLEGARDLRAGLEAVAKTCDNILEVMDRVARHYEAAAG